MQLHTNIIRAKFDASTLIASKNRSSLWSYAKSTSFHGMSYRKNVFSCIDISVMQLLTLWTSPLSDVERKFFHNVRTFITSLRAWKESVYYRQFLTIPLSLIFEHVSSHIKGSIRQTSSKLSISDHSSDMQIFYANGVESLDHIQRKLIKVVFPAICNMLVYPCYFNLLKFPSIRAFSSSTKNLLSFCKPTKISSKISRVRDGFSIRQSSESIDPKINPYTLGSFWKGYFIGFVQAQSDKVLSTTALGYRNRSRNTLKHSAPDNLYLPNLTKSKDLILRIVFERLARVLSGLLTGLFLKSRILRSLIKEINKGYLKMSYSLLRGNTGVFKRPHSSMSFPCPLSRSFMVVGFSTLFESSPPPIKREIVSIPRDSKIFRESNPLLLVGVGSKCISYFHKLSMYFVTCLCNSFLLTFLKRTVFPPLPKGRGLQTEDLR